LGKKNGKVQAIIQPAHKANNLAAKIGWKSSVKRLFRRTQMMGERRGKPRFRRKKKGLRLVGLRKGSSAAEESVHRENTV